MLTANLDTLTIFTLDILAKPLACIGSILAVEKLKTPPLSSLGLSRKNTAPSLLKGLTATTTAWISGFILIPLYTAGSCTLTFENDLVKIAVYTANFTLASGPWEEILFRGYILEQARRSLGSGKLRLSAAVSLSSALFSLSHLPIHLYVWKNSPLSTLLALAFTFLAGHMLALIYLLSGNLAGAIAAHAEWNLLSALVDVEELYTLQARFSALAVYAAVFVLTSLTLYYLPNQRVTAKLQVDDSKPVPKPEN